MWPLLLVMAAGAVFWTVRAYRQTRPQPSRRLARTLVLLRSAVFLLLVLAIAGPVIFRLLGRTRPAEIAVILEDSGSMLIGDAGADTAVTRWARALTVAADLDSALRRHDVPVVAVVLRGNGLEPITEFRLDDPVVTDPVGHGTNLAALRRQAADRLAGRPVRATVVISDGQETAGWSAEAGSRQVRRSSVGPLFVVGVGDEHGPPDRVLKDLRYPDTAYDGDEVVVEFAVDHRYLGNDEGTGGERAITARLVGPDGVVAEKTVTSTEKLVPFEMSFRPHAVGLQAYDLQVEVLDNERFPANNKASLAINVRQERARILLLAGAPSWDVRFLAQAAVREQRVALAVVHPAARGLVYADSLTPWTAPSDVSAWLKWDAVVLTGWTGPLAGIDWSVLGEAVDRGLGLLVLAGSASGPGGGPIPFAPQEELAQLLPVRVDNWRWLPGPFFVGIPAAVVGHPVLGGVGPGSAGKGAEGLVVGLASIPPVAQVANVTAAAEAVVLLTGQARTGSAPGAARVMLAVKSRGQGRVAWFGGRHLWELAFWESSRSSDAVSPGEPGHAGRRLARNLLVWTASGLEESGLVFTGRQTFFQEGEPVRLRAQWRDMRGHPVSDRQLSLILRGGQTTADSLRERTYTLRMSGSRPGLAEVELPPLAPGRYTVQLVGAGEPPVLGRQENLIVADHSLEMTQVRMNRRRLTQLAARGGGQFYDAGSPGDLRALVAELLAVDWQGDRIEQHRRVDVRSGWPLLALVVVLLGAEWFLRRRHGLL